MKNNPLAFVIVVFLWIGTIPILVHLKIPKTSSAVKMVKCEDMSTSFATPFQPPAVQQVRSAFLSTHADAKLETV
jgi:hypothetical protein